MIAAESALCACWRKGCQNQPSRQQAENMTFFHGETSGYGVNRVNPERNSMYAVRLIRNFFMV